MYFNVYKHTSDSAIKTKYARFILSSFYKTPVVPYYIPQSSLWQKGNLKYKTVTVGGKKGTGKKSTGKKGTGKKVQVKKGTQNGMDR